MGYYRPLFDDDEMVIIGNIVFLIFVMVWNFIFFIRFKQWFTLDTVITGRVIAYALVDGTIALLYSFGAGAMVLIIIVIIKVIYIGITDR